MPKTNKSISFLKNKKQTIMAKYELMEKTEVNGQVWYYIRKEDGFSVDNSWTITLEKAEEMFRELEQGKSSEPIIKILKTIEVND
jgi:hypothetical protein